MGHVESARLLDLAVSRSARRGDLPALRHIATCRGCRTEMAWTRRVVAAARGADLSDLPSPPPTHLWQRIAGGLGTVDAPD